MLRYFFRPSSCLGVVLVVVYRFQILARTERELSTWFHMTLHQGAQPVGLAPPGENPLLPVALARRSDRRRDSVVFAASFSSCGLLGPDPARYCYHVAFVRGPRDSQDFRWPCLVVY